MKNEAEYIIPLRREFLKVPRYRRVPRAIKTIKIFIAKHMKIPDRDVSRVKIDDYFNQDIWFRGIKNPPAKVKVKAIKKGENIFVTFSEMPK